MKHYRMPAWCATFLMLLSSGVLAEPSFDYGFEGTSRFDINATNNEDVYYACNFDYTFRYVILGSPKTKEISGSFGVARNAMNRNVHRNIGPWESPVLTNGPNIECFEQ